MTVNKSQAENPYVGPRPFETHERKRFFGRDREAEELVDLIVAHPAVLFYAQSGAGKSSLLNAKLLPALAEEENCEVLPVARVRGEIPAGVQVDRIKNLYVYNTLLNWAEKSDFTPDQLVDLSLDDFLQQLPHHSDDEGYPTLRVIVFDQFEELFTFYPERWPEREQFFEQVNKALLNDSHLRVIFVIREDYLAQLDPYDRMLPGQLRTRSRMERLRKEAAMTAVTGPLWDTTRTFAAGVADRLIEELLKILVEGKGGQTIEAPGEFVEPVQLQVVCQSLWADLPPDVTEITETHLLASGNVDQALAKFYERTLESANPKASIIREWRLRNWFEQQLITPAGTRGLAYRDAEKTEGIPNTVVDILESHHIIRGERRAGARWYELTHDRLIGPIQKSNAEWRIATLRKWATVVAGLVGLILVALSIASIYPDSDDRTIIDNLLAEATDVKATALVEATDAARIMATAQAEGTAAAQTEATALAEARTTAQAAENRVAQVESKATADNAEATATAANVNKATAEAITTVSADLLPANVSTAIAARQEAARIDTTAAAAAASLVEVKSTANSAAVEAPEGTVTAIAATQQAIETQATAAADAATGTVVAATQEARNATATAAAMPTRTPPPPTATATVPLTVPRTPQPTLPPTRTPAPKPQVTWPPPGWIVFASARSSAADLYIMKADGSSVSRLTQNVAFDPSYAPGSNRIAYATVRDDRALIFTINPDGSEERNIGGFDWDNWEPSLAPMVAVWPLFRHATRAWIFTQ